MSLPYIIGVTGKMGAGKSTITKDIQEHLTSEHCEVLELDKIFKETVFRDPAYRKSLNKLFEFDFFQNGSFDAESFINCFRKYPHKSSLNGQLISMMMYREIIEILELCITPIVIIESSTLFTSPLSLVCDTIIDVFCPVDIRWGRVTKRDTGRNIEMTKELFEYNSTQVIEHFSPYVSSFSYNNYSWGDDTFEKIEKHLEEKGVYELINKHKEFQISSNSPTFISDDFMRGDLKNTNGIHYLDILNFTLEELEKTHNYIQWIFPLPTVSQFQPSAPIISIRQIEELRKDKKILGNIMRATDRMAEFYLNSSHWLNHNDHNFLRITRILTCLNLFGLYEMSRKFYDEITRLIFTSGFNIQDITLKYWREALKVTLEEYQK